MHEADLHAAQEGGDADAVGRQVGKEAGDHGGGRHGRLQHGKMHVNSAA